MIHFASSSSGITILRPSRLRFHDGERAMFQSGGGEAPQHWYPGESEIHSNHVGRTHSCCQPSSLYWVRKTSPQFLHQCLISLDLLNDSDFKSFPSFHLLFIPLFLSLSFSSLSLFSSQSALLISPPPPLSAVIALTSARWLLTSGSSKSVRSCSSFRSAFAARACTLLTCDPAASIRTCRSGSSTICGCGASHSASELRR